MGLWAGDPVPYATHCDVTDEKSTLLERGLGPTQEMGARVRELNGVAGEGQCLSTVAEG